MKKRKTARTVAAGALRRKVSTAPADARPSSEFKLTTKERALLQNPEWMTEDEADLIIAMRTEAEGGEVPLEDVLAEHGIVLED